MHQRRVLKLIFSILSILVIVGIYFLWTKSETIDYSPIKFAIEDKRSLNQVKNISFILEADTKQDFPSKTMVYYLLPHTIKTREVVKIANKLLQRPLKKNEWFRFYFKKNYEIKENGTFFWANKDGSFSFMLDKYHEYTERIPKNLPDDQQAKSLAEGYLKYLGVWEEDLTLEELRTHKVDIKGVKSVPVAKMLSYSQAIDGYKIYGRRIGIDIIDLGRISGVSSGLRKYQPFGEYYLRDLKRAFLDIPNYASININPEAKLAKILSIEFAYYQEASPRKHRFLHPVFVFHGIAGSDEKWEPFTAFVPAVDEDKLSD